MRSAIQHVLWKIKNKLISIFLLAPVGAIFFAFIPYKVCKFAMVMMWYPIRFELLQMVTVFENDRNTIKNYQRIIFYSICMN